VAALLDRGVYDPEVFAAEGWLTGLRYEDEIIDDLKKRTGGKVGRPRLRLCVFGGGGVALAMTQRSRVC
jgi:hypothetical protein